MNFAPAAAGKFVNGIDVDRDRHFDRCVDSSGSGFDLTANMVGCERIHRSAAADRTVLVVVVLFDTLSDCKYDHDTVVNPSAVNCLNLNYRMLQMLACVSRSGCDLVDHIHWTESVRQVHSNDIDSILRD